MFKHSNSLSFRWSLKFYKLFIYNNQIKVCIPIICLLIAFLPYRNKYDIHVHNLSFLKASSSMSLNFELNVTVKQIILPQLLSKSKESRVHYFATHAPATRLTSIGILMYIFICFESISVELICANNDVLVNFTAWISFLSLYILLHWTKIMLSSFYIKRSEAFPSNAQLFKKKPLRLSYGIKTQWMKFEHRKQSPKLYINTHTRIITSDINTQKCKIINKYVKRNSPKKQIQNRVQGYMDPRKMKR
jgi:hypothetical protein